MVSEAADIRPKKRLAHIGAVVLHEVRLVIPPTLFFFVGFNLILLTKRLFLADYLIAYTGFLIATTSAVNAGEKMHRRTGVKMHHGRAASWSAAFQFD